MIIHFQVVIYMYVYKLDIQHKLSLQGTRTIWFYMPKRQNKLCNTRFYMDCMYYVYIESLAVKNCP